MMSSLKPVFIIGILVCMVRLGSCGDRPCSMTSECEPGECCLSPVVRRGKREAEGYCKPRGIINSRCYVKNDQLQAPDSELLYYDACPCLSTVECQGTGVIEVPQGEQGTCVVTGSSIRRAGSCSKTSDCAQDECCASLVQPVGRRKRGVGQCKRRLQDGESCLVRSSIDQDVNYECPCVSGMTCKGLGLYEIPLGERGICTS